MVAYPEGLIPRGRPEFVIVVHICITNVPPASPPPSLLIAAYHCVHRIPLVQPYLGVDDVVAVVRPSLIPARRLRVSLNRPDMDTRLTANPVSHDDVDP